MKVVRSSATAGIVACDATPLGQAVLHSDRFGGQTRRAYFLKKLKEKAMDRRSFLVGALAAGGITPAFSRRMVAARQRPATPSTSSALAGSLHMLVFDTFDTVVDWRSSVSSEVEKLARERGWKV